MGKEIERKFVPTHIPYAILVQMHDRIKIWQFYTQFKPEEIRYRMAEANNGMVYYFKTIKKGTGIERDEDEKRIFKEEYYRALGFSNYCLIKERYQISKSMSIDIYVQPKDLAVIEVEFDTLEEAKAFNPPNWFGVEVTGRPQYSNSYLYRKMRGMIE